VDDFGCSDGRDASATLMNRRILIFIPTFNESGNVRSMHEQLAALNLDADILFLDDNSPDGTGRILDELAARDKRVEVIHRTAKLGIGSAHQEGMARAYDGGYEILVTLDCDFTHSPDEILKLLAEAERADVVIGSRFIREDSLAEWKIERRILTHAGHFLTHRLLKVKQDATTAFRVYDLKTIPREVFSLATSSGYSFFFESLFILQRNGFRIREVATTFSTRSKGESKLSLREAVNSLRRLASLYVGTLTQPQKFRLQRVAAKDDRTPL